MGCRMEKFLPVVNRKECCKVWLDDVVYIEIKGDYKSKVTIPTPPVKEGYKFMGWDQEIPSRMPAYNMTFKAIFQEIDNISGVMKVDIVVFKKKDLFK